jgi:hypothetical protein
VVQSDHGQGAVSQLTHIYVCITRTGGIGGAHELVPDGLKQYAMFNEWVRCAVPSVHRRHAIAEGG